jgi:hypothetical protein
MAARVKRDDGSLLTSNVLAAHRRELAEIEVRLDTLDLELRTSLRHVRWDRLLHLDMRDAALARGEPCRHLVRGMGETDPEAVFRRKHLLPHHHAGSDQRVDLHRGVAKLRQHRSAVLTDRRRLARRSFASARYCRDAGHRHAADTRLLDPGDGARGLEMGIGKQVGVGIDAVVRDVGGLEAWDSSCNPPPASGPLRVTFQMARLFALGNILDGAIRRLARPPGGALHSGQAA